MRLSAPKGPIELSDESDVCFLCCHADRDVRDACCDCSFKVHSRCLARLLMVPGVWTCSTRRGLRAASSIGLEETRSGARSAARRAFWEARRGARFRLARHLHGAFEQLLQEDCPDDLPFYYRYRPRAAVAHCGVCRAPFRSVVGVYYVDSQLTQEGLLMTAIALGIGGPVAASLLAFQAGLYALFVCCVGWLLLYVSATLSAANLVYGERLRSDPALVRDESSLHFGVLDPGPWVRAVRLPRNMAAAVPAVTHPAAADVGDAKLVGPQ